MSKREALFLQYVSDISILSCMREKENTSSRVVRDVAESFLKACFPNLYWFSSSPQEVFVTSPFPFIFQDGFELSSSLP